jgi:hypothetical protein
MPLLRTASSQPVRSLGGGSATPQGGPGLGVRSFGFGGAVLGLTANSILLRPFPPAAGAPLSVSVQLANLDRAPARQARVKVSVDGDNLGEVVVDVPASGTAIATGFHDWTTRPGRHDVRASVTQDTRTGEASKPVFVMGGEGRGLVRSISTPAGTRAFQASAGTRGFPALGKPAAATFKPELQPGIAMLGASSAPADLAITPADIRFTPAAPAAGTPLIVAITVHNAGAGLARDGRVLAVLAADGREVARQAFAAVVPAHGVLPLQWSLTAPGGAQLVVTATATTSGDPSPANNQARAATGLSRPLPLRTPATLTLPR